MRLTQRQELMAVCGHTPDIHKRHKGMTPIAPARPVYGTTVRCECGWRWQTNESPTKGGNKLCLEQWDTHAEEAILAALDETEE